MAFNYDAALGTDRDMVRFRVGDTVENAGPLPGGANFADAEIDALLAQEGSVYRAVAALYEALATRWATSVDAQIGPRREAYSQTAARYQSLAKQHRDAYGHAPTTSMVSGFITRQDAYSDDISAEQE